MSKKAELHHLIDSTKPDIIIGTETWLHEGINPRNFYLMSLAIASTDLIEKQVLITMVVSSLQ